MIKVIVARRRGPDGAGLKIVIMGTVLSVDSLLICYILAADVLFNRCSRAVYSETVETQSRD